MNVLSSFTSYKDLPRLWGPVFMPLGFVGRLPTSMIIIGVLTLVTHYHGIAEASISSAVLAIATGIGQPLIGQWTDRSGQRLPFLLLGPANAVLLTGLVIVNAADAPFWAVLVMCALVGVTTVPVGALMRVRWYSVARTPKALTTAMSYETVADEMNFVLGPAIVGILASAIAPEAPLIVSAVIAATCVTALGLHRSVPTLAQGESRKKAPTLARTFILVWAAVISMMFLGSYFGSMQTSTTAAAVSFGSASYAGLIYSAMGVGAAITALGAVAIPERISQGTRIFVSGVALALLIPLAPFAQTPWQLAGLLFVFGLAIGPASVAMFTLASRLAPKGGDGVAMTLLGATNVGGVAIGAASAGQLLKLDLAYGFWVASASGAVMGLIGLMAALRYRGR
ncbi:MFS transporter [Flaviflexus salsibiostraticola]|uniref:MFS transporter n=2 Tax=Flaviflexus salsibiostraticola TaxID=1282737 RepID=A0A3S8Z6H2_9ACTO|nr:MFS transporter [Flaviflexus salsibiostraticola]